MGTRARGFSGQIRGRLRQRAFDLDADEVSVVVDGEVVGGAVAQGLVM
jgi:hypothetical protein